MCSLWFCCGKLSVSDRLTIDGNTDKHKCLKKRESMLYFGIYMLQTLC